MDAIVTELKLEYRGHDITISRDLNVCDDMELLFWGIFRQSDGYEVDSGYSYSTEELQVYAEGLKPLVDDSFSNNRVAEKA